MKKANVHNALTVELHKLLFKNIWAAIFIVIKTQLSRF